MDHFNELHPATAERLALLVEEMAEAQQVIGKILRHGIESRWPKPDGPTNRSMLEKELGDVLLAVELLVETRDLDMAQITNAKLRKRERIGQFLHHSLPHSVEA